MKNLRNPHHVLGVPSNATVKQVKSAYRKLCLVHHPNKGGCPKTFMQIKHAYEVIIERNVDHNDEVHEAISNIVMPEYQKYVRTLAYWDGTTFIIVNRKWCRPNLTFAEPGKIMDSPVIVLFV